MKQIRGTFVAAAACLMLGVPACDQSKAELEQAKTQLQAVTAERDALKNQVNGLQGQVSTLQQQLGDANAKLAASAAAAQPAAAAPHAPAHHSRPSTGSTSESQPLDQTQPPPTPAQLEQKAAEKQMTGKASMNN